MSCWSRSRAERHRMSVQQRTGVGREDGKGCMVNECLLDAMGFQSRAIKRFKQLEDLESQLVLRQMEYVLLGGQLERLTRAALAKRRPKRAKKSKEANGLLTASKPRLHRPTRASSLVADLLRVLKETNFSSCPCPKPCVTSDGLGIYVPSWLSFSSSSQQAVF
ncbi:hypothetical protein BO78DRAFT_222688 [Aspergillus sclerotiicarbonarius CBS 121057]|uniref:Uncharacterized protein n=1 Tax=Aspergillus sclerotiicarbonarius (strain CBS 121057 / IBT 28362) TaxID=1448318 RepID=A0A319EF02_ASPSB|nr:hypothetical protein BO78DRAFT_222688 [Aspergillus sclerotiicarbonarius CBS 121057]